MLTHRLLCTRTTRSAIRAAAVLLALLSTTAAASAAPALADPRIGTWELDLARSTFSPGPPPKRQTLWYKVDGQQMTALLQGIDGHGRPINPDAGNFAIVFDGRDHQTPRPGFDTSSWKRLSPNKYIASRKKAGKVVLTSVNEVSPDGRTLTITTTGTDEDGHQVSNVRVYARQTN